MGEKRDGRAQLAGDVVGEQLRFSKQELRDRGARDAEFVDQEIVGGSGWVDAWLYL